LKTRKSLSVIILGLFMLPGNAAFADKDKHEHEREREHEHDGDHDNGHWRDRERHRDYDDDDDRRGYGFGEHDRDECRGWYTENYRHLPPGFTRRDRLPPSLEVELVLRRRFPPDLERRVYVVPVELERRLPPPPPDYERVAIGGHIVLRNRNTKIIVDIFHFE
jgi:Ni/Co efflux regulator RcnB